MPRPEWIERVRSTLAALLESVERTCDEASEEGGALAGILDRGQLMELRNDLSNAECLAGSLVQRNPLDIVFPSALEHLFKKGGAA